MDAEKTDKCLGVVKNGGAVWGKGQGCAGERSVGSSSKQVRGVEKPTRPRGETRKCDDGPGHAGPQERWGQKKVIMGARLTVSCTKKTKKKKPKWGKPRKRERRRK